MAWLAWRAGLFRGAIRLPPAEPGLLPLAPGARGNKKFAGKARGRTTARVELKGPEICKDPVLLTTHAMGVNIYKDGQEVKLKPDSEYPEWLFNIHIGPPKKLDELDPDTLQYWRHLRKLNTWHEIKVRNRRR
ncbi:large ribosomal subunit protein mL54 [Pogona vitticeps]|uniref:Large ribosomal subunit protein mL54 n=1 Tax=Pogona vitticeps TaxID=103695 RepID=A0A6J0SKG7_9SAUR